MEASPYGALALAQVNSDYRIIVGRWGLLEPGTSNALRVNHYSLEPNGYWSTPEGLNATRR
jgi:hypothetical protein